MLSHPAWMIVSERSAENALRGVSLVTMMTASLFIASSREDKSNTPDYMAQMKTTLYVVAPKFVSVVDLTKS